MITAPWYEFLVVGSIAFWLAAIGFFIVIASLVEYERSYEATFAFVACFLVFSFLSNAGILSYLLNIKHLIFFLIGFITLGVPWGFAKWFAFTIDKANEFKELMEKFLRTHKCKVEDLKVKGTPRDDFIRYLNSYFISIGIPYGNSLADVKPQWKKNLNRIVLWGVYFPFSIASFICKDFLRNIFKRIFQLCGKQLSAIADYAYKGIDLEDEINLD